MTLGYVALAGWAVCACGWAVALAGWRRERRGREEETRVLWEALELQRGRAVPEPESLYGILAEPLD